MHHRSLFRLCVVVAGFGLAASSLAAGAQQDTTRRGRKYKPPPPTARIEVTILRDFNGKPIENAAVVFHPMAGEKDKGNMELKTNEDGKTVIDVLTIGDTVRLQVIAAGFQTYGEDYKIDKAEMAIEIRLKRPGEQYSIYKSHAATPDAGKSAGGDKTANPDKDAAPAKDAASAPSKDKPAGSADQPDGQPNQPQPK
ncbi:MAG TPA: carboxypeptidase-like regulatory domain-containing protein [Terracidiphilus sp.]|nr:carboxypeptidase-like regulatory domain-containing protein [Terracidiphilus sp.]